MSNRQEARVLKRIHDRLVKQYEGQPNGDVQAANEFQTYLAMWKSNIPLKFWECEISDVEAPNVRQKIERYISRLEEAVRKGYGLYFHGTQGTGKTLVACLIAKEAIKQGYRVYFTMLTEVLEKYCDSRYDQDARAVFARNILGADFLVLDDVDKAYISEKTKFIDSAYDYFFRMRANKNLPIIITSNMEMEQFTRQEGLSFGKSLFSLLTEHCYDIHVYGRDRRKIIQKKLEEFFNG